MLNQLISFTATRAAYLDILVVKWTDTYAVLYLTSQIISYTQIEPANNIKKYFTQMEELLKVIKK